MPIRMPTYRQLSKEQLTILEDTELDENLLVLGPPGTGKTVIALWRANQICSGGSGDTADLIMFNTVLVAYSNQWEGQESAVKVQTYNKWAWHFWNDRFNRRPPQLAPFEYDWEEMLSTLLNSGQGLGHLIVDEGQDLPNSFFLAAVL